MTQTRLTMAGHAPLLFDRLDLRPLGAATVIDLSDLVFVSPLDLVGLASLISAAPVKATIQLIPPTSDPVANYLLRMDFPASLGNRVAVEPPFGPEWPRDETPALIELTHLQHAADVDAISTRVWEAGPPPSKRNVHQCVQDHRGAGGQRRNARGEPLRHLPRRSVLQRSDSGMPEGFWIAVADSGIGVRAHLAQNPRHRHLDDVRAIQAAVQPRVTGTADVQRGWGLVSVRREAGREAAGRLIIRSGKGEGWFFVGPDGTSTARYRVHDRPVIGTWILALAGSRRDNRAP